MSYGARKAAALAVAATLLAAAVVLLVLLAPRWHGKEGGTFAVDGMRVSTILDPQSALVGDVVTARVRIFVDTADVVPSSVRLAQSFAPFAAVSTRRAVVRGIGSAARVDYTYALQCVTVSCVAGMERVVKGRTLLRQIPVPVGTVTFLRRDGATAKPLSVGWPLVILRSRLDTDSTEQQRPRPAAYRAPDVSYAVAPTLLGWLSVGFAALLALVGGTLVALAVRGRPSVGRLRIPSHLTPIDRAVALTRHARASGDAAAERKALERLAAVLRDAGEDELGGRVQALAWSRELASHDALGDLSPEIEAVRHGR